ncbi:MAG: hypothetical protein RLZZ364_312, partial [Actinomycetota bacterium]
PGGRRGAGSPRQLLLRPAGLGGAAGELRRDRQRQHPARSLVQARTLADSFRSMLGAQEKIKPEGTAKPPKSERTERERLHHGWKTAESEHLISRHLAAQS